ncbi:MAG: hypothetical protein IJD67_01550, partial [Clostridia bacterium]|nr:hypothetical protein [Clostridia bacterium]
KPESTYYDGAASGKLTLSLWHRANAPTYGKDFAEIEYIGFFSSKKQALEYEGEIARLSAEVGFYVNGELINTATVKKGSALVYPDKLPQIAGYRISGWSVPEGSIVNGDLKVNAVLVKDESTRSLVFTADNLEVTSNEQFTGELREENGLKYYHFTVTSGKISDDHSRINVSPKSNSGYDSGEYPYMKITYRTNPRNSSGFELNIKTNDKMRVWGPRIEYSAKGKWTEQTLDLRTVGWNGGESVAANLKSEQYFENYFTEPISLIIIKPYKAVGIWMDTTEYYDIAGVAFFADKESADKYSMLK